MALIQMRRGESEYVIVEVEGPATKPSGVGKATGIGNTAEAIVRQVDQALDRVLIHEIVENCRTINAAFDELVKAKLSVTEASAEFGLKVSGEGNVYIVKTCVEAAFTITVKWKLAGSATDAAT